jgi:hypothetical protein
VRLISCQTHDPNRDPRAESASSEIKVAQAPESVKRVAPAQRRGRLLRITPEQSSAGQSETEQRRSEQIRAERGRDRAHLTTTRAERC